MNPVAYIGIHHPSTKNGNYFSAHKSLDYGKNIALYQKLGFQPVITTKATFMDNDLSLGLGSILMPSFDKNGRMALKIEHIAKDAIKGINSRFLSNHPYIHQPLLNSNAIKNVAGSKYNLSQLLGNLGIPTILLDPSAGSYEAVMQQASHIGADYYVLKPDSGWGGKGIQKISKVELPSVLKTFFTSGDKASYILQPYIETSRLHDGIKAYDQKGQQLINYLRSNNNYTEIRMFTVLDNDKLVAVPILRADKSGDKYFSGRDIYLEIILPDNINKYLTQKCRLIVDRMSKKTGNTKQILGAIDFIYDGRRFWVMEANFRSPELPASKKHTFSAPVIQEAVVNAIVNAANATNKH